MTHDCVDDLFNMVIHQVLIYLIYLMIQLLNMAMASIAKCWMIGWPEVQFWLERWSHSWHHKKTCWILRLRGSGGLAIWVLKVLAFADEFHPSKHAEVWDLRTPWYVWYCLIGSSGLRVSVFLFFLQQMRLYCILGAAGTTHVWAIAMFKWCFKTLSWYDTES